MSEEEKKEGMNIPDDVMDEMVYNEITHMLAYRIGYPLELSMGDVSRETAIKHIVYKHREYFACDLFRIIFYAYKNSEYPNEDDDSRIYQKAIIDIANKSIMFNIERYENQSMSVEDYMDRNMDFNKSTYQYIHDVTKYALSLNITNWDDVIEKEVHQ